MVPLVTVRRNACASPEAVNWTAPICDIPRFSSRSPALAHTTIAKTITSVLIRSLFSLAIYGGQSFPEAAEVPGTETMVLSKSPPLRTHFNRSARNFRNSVASW
jgi:hypothetical protein